MTVHNHGTEDGPGLACRETRMASGGLRGACMEPSPYPACKVCRLPFSVQVLADECEARHERGQA